MPMPLFAHQDDAQPLNRTVKKLLNTDGPFINMVAKYARTLKATGHSVVVSATIYGTSLIIRVHEASQVAPWRDVGDQPNSPESVFWYTLHESSDYLVTLNDPQRTTTQLERVIQTCTMLECNELDAVEA